MRPTTAGTGAGASASASTPATNSLESDTAANSLPAAAAAAQPPPTSIPVSRRLSSAVGAPVARSSSTAAPLSFVGGGSSSPRRTLNGHGHGPQPDHPAIHPVAAGAAATAAGIPPPPSPFGFLSPRPALAPGSPAGTRASAATPVSSMGGYGSFWRAPAAPVFSNSSLSPSSSLQSFVPQYSTMGSRHGGGGGAYYVGTAAGGGGGGGSGQAGAGSPRPGNNTSHAAWGAGNASAAAAVAQVGSASASNADNLKWSANFAEGTTFQENSAVSYTWNIRDVQLLREEVERSPAPSEGGRSVSAGAGKSEVWTTQPIFGDGKWKLELVRTKRPSDEADDAPVPSDSFADDDTPPEAADKDKGSTTAGTTVLSVYLTSLALSNASPHLFQRAYIMLGIKPVRHWSGVHSHRAGSWLWRHFEAFDFTKENDYWECHQLPSLSELLQDGDVEEQDAFSLTVQIATGPGVMPFTPGETLDNTTSTLDCRSTSTVASRTAMLPFELPGALHVPRSLLSSLEALVDCAQTGDVRILVRERGIIRSGADTPASLLAEDLHRVELYPVGAAIPLFEEEEDDGEGGGGGSAADPLIVVRDRVIWAHSAVLRARSEYFAHMLDSAFVEGRGGAAYGAYNQQQQQQSGARQIHTIRIPDSDFTTVYWVVRHLYLDEIEFSRDEDVRGAAFDEDWMMRAQDSEAEVAAAAASVAAPTLAFPSPLDEPVWDWRTLKEVVGDCDVGGTTSTDGASPTSYSAAALAPSRHALSDRGSIGSSSSSSTQQAPTRASAPLRRGWHTDPHMHPTTPAAPASSLAIYRLAHRYLLPHLAALSSAHLVSSLTPRSAFPVLLATSLFDDVHAGVTRYVFQHWELVNETHEFARCCDEVGRGEWGAQAGNALRLFMRHLVSPARVVGRAAA